MTIISTPDRGKPAIFPLPSTSVNGCPWGRLIPYPSEYSRHSPWNAMDVASVAIMGGIFTKVINAPFKQPSSAQIATAIRQATARFIS